MLIRIKKAGVTQPIEMTLETKLDKQSFYDIVRKIFKKWDKKLNSVEYCWADVFEKIKGDLLKKGFKEVKVEVLYL